MSQETLELLLVEDDTAYVALICHAFAPQAEAVRLTIARSLQEARVRIAESQPDLALIAWRLPDGAGIELIPTAREARPYPVIIMTTPGNVHVAVEAMKAGAVDCVVKSETPLSAIPRIAAQALRQWGESRERKRTEAELRKFSVAVEQSPSMIVMTDFDGIIEYVNAQFTQVTGYSPEDMIGTQLALPPSPCATVSGLWSTIQADGGWRGEWSNNTKNGASYLESMSISSLRNAAGDITHFLVVKADITAAAHMQQHLAQAERLASLRTLAVGLAHELNQPLTAIRVPVDSLLYGHKRGWTITEERFVDSLQLVSAQCDRVAAILHDVRTFASGDATHHGGSGSLQEGLARVQRLIGTQIIAHGIELQPQIPPELPRVCLHQADLEQVLMASQHASIAEWDELEIEASRSSVHAMLLRPWAISQVLWYWLVIPGIAARFAREHVPDARFVIVGHTHRPGIWRRNGRTVINTGSYGFPGRPRAVVIEERELSVWPIRTMGDHYELDARPIRTFDIKAEEPSEAVRPPLPAAVPRR